MLTQAWMVAQAELQVEVSWNSVAGSPFVVEVHLLGDTVPALEPEEPRDKNK